VAFAKAAGPLPFLRYTTGNTSRGAAETSSRTAWACAVRRVVYLVGTTRAVMAARTRRKGKNWAGQSGPGSTPQKWLL